MTPAEVSKELNRIATSIDASKKPRPDLVAADIKRILTSLVPKSETGK